MRASPKRYALYRKVGGRPVVAELDGKEAVKQHGWPCGCYVPFWPLAGPAVPLPVLIVAAVVINRTGRDLGEIGRNLSGVELVVLR